MFLRRKNFWCLVIFIFLINLQTTASQEIEFNVPEEVNVGEEFEIAIKLIDFEKDTYDVKIDIFYNEERISKILNKEKWKSTFYYVNDVIEEDEEKEFSLILDCADYKDGDKAEIEIKIRNSKENYETFSGYKIELIGESDKGEGELENNDENNKEEAKEELKENKIENLKEDSEEEYGYSNQVITLNPKTIKTDENSQEDNKKKIAICGLIGFCFLLAGLFIFKFYKNKKKDGIV